jgi:hypothetical protein
MQKVMFCFNFALFCKQQQATTKMERMTVTSAMHMLTLIQEKTISALGFIQVMETLASCDWLYGSMTAMCGLCAKLSHDALLKYRTHAATHNDDPLLAPCVAAQDWTEIRCAFLALSQTPVGDLEEAHVVAFLAIEDTILSIPHMLLECGILNAGLVSTMQANAPEKLYQEYLLESCKEKYKGLVGCDATGKVLKYLISMMEASLHEGSFFGLPLLLT